jgi:hypothetical protein
MQQNKKIVCIFGMFLLVLESPLHSPNNPTNSEKRRSAFLSFDSVRVFLEITNTS